MSKQQIANLIETINKLSDKFDCLQASHESQAIEIASKLTAEAVKSAKKFQVLDLRLNETRGPSIHDENDRIVENIKERLPKKLSLIDLPKFTGTEDPLIHIKAFKGQMAIKGVEKELWSTIFPHSLGPIAQTWYYTLDNKKITTWEEITVAFTDQYRDNVENRVSLRTLEVLTQSDNEGFTDFLTRWRAISTQLTPRPVESELVTKFINNLKPVYADRLRYSTVETFRQLITVGTKIEDDIRTGVIPKPTARGYQGSSSRTSYTNDDEVNTLDVLSSTKNIRNEGQRRTFTPLGMTYTQAFEELSKSGVLKPIGPTPDPEEKTKYWKEGEFCPYHRGRGHNLEGCRRLRHKIEDLIESGKVSKPKSSAE